MELRLVMRLDLGRIAKKDELPSELAFVFVEILFRFQFALDRDAAGDSVRRCAPCPRQSPKLGDVGRNEPQGAGVVAPARAEWAPGLEMRVRKPKFGQFVAGPLIRPLHVGRSG